MNLLKLIFAYAALFALSLFISSNVKDVMEGSGYEYLAVSVLSFMALVLVSGEFQYMLQMRKASLLFLLFLAYFVPKWYFESGDVDETKMVTVGTTVGLIFAFTIGFISSLSLSTIYTLRYARGTKYLALFLGVVYLLFVLAISWDGFETHRAGARTDLFLIEDEQGFYQRVGDLVLMQIMLLTALSMVIFSTSREITVAKALPLLLIILLVAAIFGFTAQLVGSNSGLIATAAFVVVFFVCFLVTYFEQGAPTQASLSVTSLLFGPYAFKLALSAVLASLLVLLAGYFALEQLEVDMSMLRISNYGEGELTSLTARQELFKENFLDHFLYSPVFGHTQVEKLTSGSGTYVHSVLSIATHLGLIGFTIFVVMLAYLYFEITSAKRAEYDSIYSSRHYGLFRLLALGAVLAMALYSAFFTWMPLWFAIAMFGAWYFPRECHEPRRYPSASASGR